MRGKFSLVHLYIVQFVKWALNHYICVYSLHNSSTSAFCQQRHIHIGISVQLPSVLLYPTSHIWLHSVNHASQIAPWSPSTLKWWKWIKLITDSHRESWQGIKSFHWSAAAHPSAAFYDGENLVGFPSPFCTNLHQSTTPTDTATSPILNAPCDFRHLIFI